MAKLWVPRLLAAAVSLFLGLFSLDALSGADTLAQAVPDFLIHLIPSAIILTVLALSWNREWIGAVAFIAMAAGYAVVARAHPSWIVAIAGPLLVTGALYAWSWMRRRTLA